LSGWPAPWTGPASIYPKCRNKGLTDVTEEFLTRRSAVGQQEACRYV